MFEQQDLVREEGIYKKASAAVDKILVEHRGEKFALDDVCKWLNILDSEKRRLIARKLNNDTYGKHPVLEKFNSSRPPLYRYIDHTIEYMNWRTSKGAKNLELRWPCGTDQSQFGFDGRVQIPEKGMVILAGVTNTGKSVFARNFLWMNMDAYKCIYFSSETSEDDFADYASRMTWANPVNEDGTDKFQLVWRDKDFKDVIDPDAVNIIDWLDIYKDFYEIGHILTGVKAKLNTGIVLVAIQKHPEKGLGVGGMWAEHKASLYLTMDYGRITVEKAKKWQEWNPNHKTWGFQIVDGGTHFHNIHPLKKCGFCWNGKKNNMICPTCDGTGWVNDEPLATW